MWSHAGYEDRVAEGFLGRQFKSVSLNQSSQETDVPRVKAEARQMQRTFFGLAKGQGKSPSWSSIHRGQGVSADSQGPFSAQWLLWLLPHLAIPQIICQSEAEVHRRNPCLSSLRPTVQGPLSDDPLTEHLS